jgi:hypothetical protein
MHFPNVDSVLKESKCFKTVSWCNSLSVLALSAEIIGSILCQVKQNLYNCYLVLP